MELPPLPINITLNQERNRAILHINCQSDATATRWIGNKEEASTQAEKVWLGKLGCLLKLHGDIEGQWLYPLAETTINILPHPDLFNDPWAYSLSNFPQGYKLFSVERETQGDDHSRKDHYLFGMFFFSSTSNVLLISSVQVENTSTGLHKNSTLIYTGYLTMPEG